ncbi:hypothetical protein ACFZCK_11300 [Kitasatospora purpeofusca]|uniref:hypothetical protein n=1 Tax=Kitasatospora purpeofusca TaxID=67352 RepID=UPI0036EFA4F4
MTSKSLRTGVTMAGVLLAAGVFGVATATTAAATTTQVVAGPQSDPGKTSRATCPNGTHLIGGGYDWYPALNRGGGILDGEALIGNGPSQDGRAWVTQARLGQTKAWALCETD